MDFTEIYKQSSNLVAFSPGAHFILTAVHDRIIIRRTDSFQITRTWQIDSSPSQTQSVLGGGSSNKTKATPPNNAWITHAGWSCDSEYVFAACAKRGAVHVFKLRDEEWSARIDAGAEGLVKAEWAPDGRTILCFSEWGLRVTIWSLVTGSSTYIQYPIHPDKGYTFRADGRYFVLAERHKSKDTLGLYDAAESYKLVRHFPLPTSSLASFVLSPTGNNIAVWEGILEYKLYIITLAGKLLASFTPDPEPTLGIREVAWHPTGVFLAVAGWDDRIYILDSMTWAPAATFELAARIPTGVTIWREPANWQESTEGRGFLSYDRLHTPYSLTLNKPDPSKPHPKSGVVQLGWNRTGTMLLARFETTPNVLHLYHFPSPSLPPPLSSLVEEETSTSRLESTPKPKQNESEFAPKLRSVLIHIQPITHVRWNPVRAGSLALCCGSRGMYTWSDEWEGEEVAECIGVPAKQFDTRDLRWAPDGKGMVLLDKDKFCCAFEVEEEAQMILCVTVDLEGLYKDRSPIDTRLRWFLIACSPPRPDPYESDTIQYLAGFAQARAQHVGVLIPTSHLTDELVSTPILVYHKSPKSG
ncbi:wd repeat-containing protein 8 [Moniliophthora roreri]|uniref:Uncharacterized protein n=1 Tax=Moniliophthora roreri TaxID=221103 RepID=A0A0W0FS95_MONRR|nr:wd repeat-containing protein 8 [Moniliophthora roreri]